MSVAVVGDHVGYWTEAEYFALGETLDRIELIDGTLIVSPNPTIRHQLVAKRLANQLDAGAEAAGLIVLPEINMRLRTDRVFEPDIVVADTDEEGLYVEAAEVKLAIEIVSPGSTGIDRLLKPQYYAAAGIGWYLRVEQSADSITLHLFRLDAGLYAEVATAGPGETLTSDEPFSITVNVDDLSRRR